MLLLILLQRSHCCWSRRPLLRWRRPVEPPSPPLFVERWVFSAKPSDPHAPLRLRPPDCCCRLFPPARAGLAGSGASRRPPRAARLRAGDARPLAVRSGPLTSRPIPALTARHCARWRPRSGQRARRAGILSRRRRCCEPD